MAYKFCLGKRKKAIFLLRQNNAYNTLYFNCLQILLRQNAIFRLKSNYFIDYQYIIIFA